MQKVAGGINSYFWNCKTHTTTFFLQQAHCKTHPGTTLQHIWRRRGAGGIDEGDNSKWRCYKTHYKTHSTPHLYNTSNTTHSARHLEAEGGRRHRRARRRVLSTLQHTLGCVPHPLQHTHTNILSSQHTLIARNPSPGGVHLFGWNPNEEPEENGIPLPPWNPTPKGGSLSRGGPLSPGSSFGTHPTRRPPRGGRFFAINFARHPEVEGDRRHHRAQWQVVSALQHILALQHTHYTTPSTPHSATHLEAKGGGRHGRIWRQIVTRIHPIVTRIHPIPPHRLLLILKSQLATQ